MSLWTFEVNTNWLMWLKRELLNLIENEKVILLSSKTGENVKELKELIQNIIINQNPYKYKKNEMKGDVDTFGNWSC